jgi:hypothetical protein
MIILGKETNVSLENINFPKNSVVLLRQRTYETKTGINTVINYVAVDGIKDTNDVSIVKTLLSALLAEYRVKSDFNIEFATIKDDSGNIIANNSGIFAKRVISPFLNGNTIYRTDSTGKLNKALRCENGTKLKDTCLSIKDGQIITRLNSAALRAALHNQSLAIIKQSVWLTSIAAMQAAIEADMEAKVADKTVVVKKAA